MFNWIKSLNTEVISCILPTYNRSIFLERSLLHLYQQTIDLNKIEVIVVDDGSNSDSNFHICEAYKSCQMNIKYIKLEENTGTVSIPRAIGISHASGATIAHIDDDCFCKPEKLELLYNMLWQLYIVWAPLAYGKRDEYTYNNGVFKYFRTVGHTSIGDNVGMDNGQFIYKAEVFGRIKFPLAINACDWELYKEINHAGGYFLHTDTSVCKYTWHSENISRIPKTKRVDPKLRIKEFKKYFAENEFTHDLFNF